jgi:hypothetical protein
MDETQSIVDNIPSTAIQHDYNNILDDRFRMNITNMNIATYRSISNTTQLELGKLILFYRIVATIVFPTQLIVGE